MEKEEAKTSMKRIKQKFVKTFPKAVANYNYDRKQISRIYRDLTTKKDNKLKKEKKEKTQKKEKTKKEKTKNKEKKKKKRDTERT